MKLTHTLAVATAAAFVALTVTAHPALADPAPADPAGGVTAADQPFSVIAVTDLPLSAAGWEAVMGHDRTAEVLPGLTACSIDGVPAAGDLDRRAAATSPVFVADLRAAGNTEGWAGTVAGASYPGIDAASYALASYRRYLEACRTAPAAAGEYHNAAVGTSVQDPTAAHALIETHDTWMEVFAVATDDGLLEATFTQPKNGPIEFVYDPAAVFSALKMADLGALARPAQPSPW
ncbi:hypothetical protein [Mycolicibacterium sp.]|uniref:hypothetical protein n=1 Tax=Mycolicibacterium sp. TaxID=2320850 RepID=UPI003560704E